MERGRLEIHLLVLRVLGLSEAFFQDLVTVYIVNS
jgi:hypothetical protein